MSTTKPPEQTELIFDIKKLCKSFGGVKAVKDCSLSLQANSITGLIGPNGAGKSTLFNMLAGNLQPDSGEILFKGEDVAGEPPHQLFHRGILRTFQLAHEFSQLSTLENLMMVPANQPGESLFKCWFKQKETLKAEEDTRQRALDVIDFLKLSHVKNELAGNLSGGQKKLLELGRTMMVDAEVVLLDEVAAGINKSLLSNLAENIERMHKELKYTFFIIEHDMSLISRLCDPVIVMAEGTKLAEGPMEALRSNQEIINAYFGGAN